MGLVPPGLRGAQHLCSRLTSSPQSPAARIRIGAAQELHRGPGVLVGLCYPPRHAEKTGFPRRCPCGGNRCSSGLQLQRAWGDSSVAGLGLRPMGGSQLSFGQDSITEPIAPQVGVQPRGAHVVSWEKSQLPDSLLQSLLSRAVLLAQALILGQPAGPLRRLVPAAQAYHHMATT
ncbi:hypothetical protein HJG60_009824 [Phyllostomus discolor]|uniref:Uncharacterized protein n=1 Tax=Phyllostomus discolor TaxID=89673 RepID=A0A834EQF9_9CHIR|nr:hypothetical protein HJG60_009824 [Phyllostomus discolor]